MGEYEITKGEGRTRISLSVQGFGGDLVVFIYNENAHVGAVAVGEYDHKQNRASTSVITRLGHKDDVIAQKAAYLISKHTKRPSCVIAGVHLDNITGEEIEKLLEVTDSCLNGFLRRWESANSVQ
jgi:hypothetical protein